MAWGSDEWTADTQTVIKKATENGLGISLTSGAHWANANLPDTYTWDGADYNPDNKAASQELDYATISLTAGEQFAGVRLIPRFLKQLEATCMVPHPAIANILWRVL